MIAVISGDVIKSQNIPQHEYDAMLYQLDQSLRAITQRWQGQSTLYRGDAFQIQLQQPQYVCMVALLLYLNIKAAGYEIRQSLAIGEIDNARADIKTATGSAFTMSGRSLDEINNQRLILNITNQNIDPSLALNIAFVDTLLTKMTAKQANALYVYLTAKNKQHSELAKQLKTSRENVTKLLNLAHYQLIERFLHYAEDTISTLKGVKS
ncbi:hypothetical protein [Pseudoalteromonas porphyrae]|uniref:Uncharacterized protein n=1 Tax=Pseudoalteromonas porphyrae TaxID=187330 RepID=A0A0N1EFR2_9GAMM|nr:hypothetical protein [Pseudoalteromonas porphyrae]KPH59096.1 hypothetical protein ADS77_17140 [Pseudoalteromonas porphyrae]